MNKIMKTLSLMFAVGAMLFSSGLHHEDAKVAKAAETETSTKTYKKVTEALTDWSGEYLIVYEEGKVAFNGSLTDLKTNNKMSVIISNDTINIDDGYYFTIESNQYIKSASGKYIGNDNNSNALTSSDTQLVNTITFTNGNVNIISKGGAYLRYNNSSNFFRYYKSSTYSGQKAISLYKLYEGEITKKEYTSISVDEANSKLEYYENETFSISNLSLLGHYTEDGEAKSEEIFGFTTDLADNTILTVADYNNKEITITYEGKTTKCTLTVNQDELNSLSLTGKETSFFEGESFTIGDSASLVAKYKSGSTKDLTLSDENIRITLNDETITLPYELSLKDNGASIKIYYSENSSEEVSTIKYYITVSESIAPTVVGKWYEVTDVSDLHPNDKIIIAAKNENYALGSQNKNNRAAVEWDKNSTPDYSNIYVLILENGTKDNTFAFKTNDEYLCAASSSSNNLKTESTLSDNSSWSISIVDGVTTIKAQGEYTRNTIQFNKSAKIFSCYVSSQEDITIYKFISNYDSLLTSLSKLDTCTQYDQASNLRDLYNSLSDAEKVAFNEETIVDNEKNTGNEVTIKAIDKLVYMELLKAENEQPSSSLNLFSNNNSNNLALILIIGLLGLSSIAGYYFLNKKKYSR